jgi:hypothetical protein
VYFLLSSICFKAILLYNFRTRFKSLLFQTGWAANTPKKTETIEVVLRRVKRTDGGGLLSQDGI